MHDGGQNPKKAPEKAVFNSAENSAKNEWRCRETDPSQEASNQTARTSIKVEKPGLMEGDGAEEPKTRVRKK